MKNYKIKNVSSYTFDGLDKEAQDKAVAEYVNFLMEVEPPDDADYFVNKAIAEMERMQTPWFLGDTLYYDYRHEIEREIRLNEDQFFSDGTFFVIPKQFCAVVQ